MRTLKCDAITAWDSRSLMQTPFDEDLQSVFQCLLGEFVPEHDFVALDLGLPLVIYPAALIGRGRHMTETSAVAIYEPRTAKDLAGEGEQEGVHLALFLGEFLRANTNAGRD